jgi:uncharacterized protein (UPF0335 family)
MSKPGHNSGGLPDDTLAVIERIERLNTEKAEIAEATKEVYEEAKSSGHDTQVLRAVIRRRAQDREKVREFDDLLETYEAFLFS